MSSESETSVSETELSSETSAPETTKAEAEKIDYLVLVNKDKKIPEKWENKVSFSKFKNRSGETLKVEKKTLRMFKKLRKKLSAKGIKIDIRSAYRSRKQQKETIKYYKNRYGGEYVNKYVSTPGHSEHQTGLALDIEIVSAKDAKGKPISETKAFQKVYSAMTSFGFILRYPDGKRKITGIEFEPWHIRFIGSKKIAKKICEKGWTLEEYLQSKNKKK